jgi:hypothetical protein
MPLLAAEATNVVCATTSFHGYDAGRQGAQEIQKPMPLETLPEDNRPRLIQPRETANRLAQINA